MKKNKFLHFECLELAAPEQGFSLFPMLWAYAHRSRLQRCLFRVWESI